MRTATRVLLAVAAGGLVGCRGVPRVATDSPRDAVERIVRRAEGIEALSARGVMTMRPTDGEAVRLEVALVAGGADRLRLRAWKVGRAAMDMTVRGDDVWLWTAAGRRAGRGFDGLFFRKRIAWTLLRGGLPGRDGRIEEGPRRRFHVRFPAEERGGTLVAAVHRPTATVRAYRLVDGGRVRRRLRIARYRVVDGTPLPAEIVAEGPKGTITVTLDAVKVNPDLDAGVFEPPDRAARLGARGGG